MNERELFEKTFKTLSHTFNESLCIIPNTDRYYSNIAQASWEAWQASTNRDGYKLVPIDPLHKQLDAIKNSCVSVQKACLSDLEAYGIYKDVIGVLDER